jgi:hypothetical protein
MTALPNISAACIDDHNISIGPTSNFVPFYSPWMSLLLPWRTKWHVFVLVILGDPTTPNSTSVGSPLLIHGLEHFFAWQKPLPSYKASTWPSRSLQLVSSCGIGKSITGSCPTCSWMVGELPKLQSCLEFCWFAQAFLQPGIARWETPFLLELAWESDYDTHLNGWRITQDMQPKGMMSCLKSHCYN